MGLHSRIYNNINTVRSSADKNTVVVVKKKHPVLSATKTRRRSSLRRPSQQTTTTKNVSFYNRVQLLTYQNKAADNDESSWYGPNDYRRFALDLRRQLVRARTFRQEQQKQQKQPIVVVTV